MTEKIESLDHLYAFISNELSKNHDYNSSVEALVAVTVATFNFFADEMGMTGFQSGCADLEFIKRVRHLDAPFALVSARDMLYPQYNLHGKLDDYMKKWSKWVQQEAVRLLEENETSEFPAHPSIVSHWRTLASNAKS